jgi:hypothetical protein
VASVPVTDGLSKPIITGEAAAAYVLVTS